ncbi:MAG: hypothetical protein ACRDRM_05195 [Pseudonocardiaceae bacterium]
MTDLPDLDEQVLGWLSPGRDPGSVSQHDAQQLAWCTAPGKSPAPDDEVAEVAAACARLLERAGRWRAATALREHTPAVRAGWARSARHGSVASARAMQATGVQPPDTDALAWAALMGSEEARAFDAVQRMLESALDEGRLSVGDENWPGRQGKLVEDWLRTPGAEFAGRAPLEVIHEERAADWADAGTAARRSILRAVLPLFAMSTEPPANPVQPLRFLLEAIYQGITLAGKDRLPVDFVRDMADRFGWGMAAFIIRKEGDVVELGEIRDLATRTHLITLRLRQHALELTPAGRAALDDPARLWTIAAAGWFEHDDFAAHVAEIAAATLLRGPSATNELATTAQEAVAPSFRDLDGSHPDYREVRTATREWLRLGNALSWLDYPHGPHEQVCGLTEAGRAAAIEGLRHRARAPHQTA